jgi:hypothetical protein
VAIVAAHAHRGPAIEGARAIIESLKQRVPIWKREHYLDGYLGNMRASWTAVPPDELEQACAHVASFDFPETLADLTRMAEAAGFSKAHVVDRFAQHHVLVFSRADA